MAQIGLALQQRQDVRLTAELREAIELLQLSALDVHDLVSRELSDNPCLEMASESVATGDASTDGRADDQQWAEVSDHSFDGPIAGTFSTGGPDGDDGQGWEATAHRAQTLQDHLTAQFHAVTTEPRLRFAGRCLIDALDESGYLRLDLAEAAAQLKLSEEVLDDARAILQTLEPAGIGARDVSECLRLQLHAARQLDHPTEVCLDNLERVAAQDWPALARLAQCDEELIHDAVASIRACNPKPGLAFAQAKVEALLPDVIVEADGHGGFKVSLNGAAFPRLLVNPLPLPMGGPRGKLGEAARAYARERNGRARWLVGALEQRAATILSVARAVVAKQGGFFAAGAEFMVPLSLRDIAREVGLHESTISRVTTGTCMQTPRGVLPFRAFFASGVVSIGGTVGVAAGSVQAMIRRLTAAEQPAKPLSDEQLVKLLANEGVQVARRTVAKYREAAGIPGSSRRRVRSR
jgi:RNA polymerase sigma-54 factor